MTDLEQKLKELPADSGVYIMYDAEGTIIYIGKAVVLKNRVRQYFHASTLHPVKVRRMVERIADIKYIITSTEADALALEATLVHKHQPQYNILLKDDKHRPYIRIDTRKDFPAVEYTRRLKSDGARYFGPYVYGVGIKDILEIIVTAFALRTCAPTAFKKAKRPCINFHIGRCAGCCGGEISAEEYARNVDRAIAFLGGKNDDIKAELTRRMQAASDAEEYEVALRYRNMLSVLDKISRKLTVLLPVETDIDAIGFCTNGEYSSVCVINIRGGRMTGLTNYPVSDAALSGGEILGGFLSQYYARELPPPEILLSEMPEDTDVLAAWLKARAGRKIELRKPSRGVKREIIRTADKNATDFLEKSSDRIKYREQMTVGAVEQLRRVLGLERLPRRIECFDISNISGTDKVASMVVSLDGTAFRHGYRKFKIKTVVGADDFACMREVILRRLLRAREGDKAFADLPDLIVVDGGKGQLSAALEGMHEAGYNIEMIGLAKREEEIFLPDKSEAVVLPRQSFAIKLLQRVRDEAHRFAITYHRNLRQSRQTGKLKDKE